MAHPPTVLIVDDDEVLRRFLSRLLGSAGFHVVTAESGEDALEKLGSFVVDVLLSDIAMPGMSGIELARRATAQQPDMPILLMTGHLLEHVCPDGLEFQVLTKPFHRTDLLNKLVEMTGLELDAK